MILDCLLNGNRWRVIRLHRVLEGSCREYQHAHPVSHVSQPVGESQIRRDIPHGRQSCSLLTGSLRPGSEGTPDSLGE
jgi:hypothetical protein